MNLFRTILIVCFVLVENSLYAQLPQPVLDVIYPLGGSAGEKILLDVGGKDLDAIQSLRFSHPGLTAQPTKNPKQFEVSITPDVPAGSHELRVITANGISGVRLFAVAHGLVEVKEKEPNDTPETAQEVAVNSVINGRCDGNGDDFYRFSARKGQRIVLDCLAFRLDSQLRGQLTLSTAEGTPLLASRPYFDRVDPMLDFVAPKDGQYIVRLHDALFAGGMPYRLVITDLPHIEMVLPPAMQPGQTARRRVLGRNLPGAKPSSLKINDQPLDEVEVDLAAPAQPFGFASTFHFLSANLNVRGFQTQPAGWKHVQAPATVALVPEPIVLEREPNDSAEHAQEIPLPCAISGSLGHAGDADWYRFPAKANDAIAIDLICERVGRPGDPFVIIVDDKGNELQTFDDHGINQRAIAQFNRDPVGTFRVPKDGVYRLFVQDRYQQGNARQQYVLRVFKATPDFFPVVFHETNPDPSSPTVRQGGSAFAEICLNRRDWTGPVTVVAEGLPAGVTCPPVLVSPQSQTANLIFTAAKDAPEWTGALKLKAFAEVEGQKLEREVRPAQRRWRIANINTCVALREFCLAVRPSAPYALHLPKEPVLVDAGGSVELIVQADRLWPDFKGKIQLSGLNPPNGFNLATFDLAADQTRASLKLNVAGNVPAGDYSLAVRGDAQVPFTPDPAMKPKANIRVADPSTAALIRVRPAPKK